MLFISFRQNNHNRWQNILNADKISTMPRLYIPENTSFPAQPTSKRLSSSRNSTALPPPSLSIIQFVALHSTTHAIASIRRHTSVTSFHTLSSQNQESSRISHRMIILAGTYLFIPARSDRSFARIWHVHSRMTKFGIEKRGPVWRFVC